jgi:molybdenum cofactor guanylyltransferase
LELKRLENLLKGKQNRRTRTATGPEQQQDRGMLGQTGITGLVLAGGLSRRMGQDKALLEIQGEALLTRTCRIALPLCDRLFVITPRSTYQSLLPTGCELFREEAWRGQRTGDEAQGENNLGEGKKLEEKLKDAKPQGPLAAFHQGLARAETPWVLLLA